MGNKISGNQQHLTTLALFIQNSQKDNLKYLILGEQSSNYVHFVLEC